MPKFCANGHQMEDSWELCPYCQQTGFVGGLAKTRIESEPGAATAPAVARRTVIISERQKPPVVGWLIALEGSQKGEDFRVREGQNIIGSSAGCDIVLNESTISGRHASLRYKEGKFLLTDLDSTNGSFVNGQSLAREELKDNDVVRLGDVSFKFKCL